MKKKLEAELIIIAHKILKLKGKEDVIKMHAETSVLLEKLSVLKFAYENFDENIPVMGNDPSFYGLIDQAFNKNISDNIEVEDKIYINLDEVEEDDIMEPVMETIKDMVAQMPPETQEVDTIFEEAIPEQKHNKKEIDDITDGFEETPVFEAVSKQNGKKKSLNDTLNKSLKIGLNDKIAFIKHLFSGKSEDYERVFAQINALPSFNEAQKFIEHTVKPNYNHWIGKEEFEERFLTIIEAKY